MSLCKSILYMKKTRPIWLVFHYKTDSLPLPLSQKSILHVWACVAFHSSLLLLGKQWQKYICTNPSFDISLFNNHSTIVSTIVNFKCIYYVKWNWISEEMPTALFGTLCIIWKVKEGKITMLSFTSLLWLFWYSNHVQIFLQVNHHLSQRSMVSKLAWTWSTQVIFGHDISIIAV